ncbi:MAG TPA: hypothetical protein VEZ55_08590 [Chitinophagaceae bacterium]|nr:hypothetical protein [Chitinophagaceae bacterium]
MRKTLFIFFSLFAFLNVRAQKGTVLLYGNIYYYKDSRKIGQDYKASNAGFMPAVGVGISEKYTTGLNLVYSYYRSGGTSHVYGAGPFVRYTNRLTEVFSYFFQFNGSYRKSDSPGDYVDKTLHFETFPAIELNIKNGFALNASFGGISYERRSISDLEGANSSFRFDLGSSALIGVSKRFGKRKQ